MGKWNRCDVCGRFIGYADLVSGKAQRWQTTPDTHFTVETYATLCANHTEAPDD